jgi:hypothetical protein
MVKKNMQSIASALTPVAQNLPSQNVKAKTQQLKSTSLPNDPIVQVSFGLRKSLRKELARMADDEDVTMRSFILQALKEKGLSVHEVDLLDLRKERG